MIYYFTITIIILAFVLGTSPAFRCSQKNRLFLVLIAIGTYIVKWLGVAIVFLERIHENTSANLIKIIATCLLLPIRYFYQLIFKSAINVQQFMILRLERKKCSLKTKY
jgi:hypothetical protein